MLSNTAMLAPYTAVGKGCSRSPQLRPSKSSTSRPVCPPTTKIFLWERNMLHGLEKPPMTATRKPCTRTAKEMDRGNTARAPDLEHRGDVPGPLDLHALGAVTDPALVRVLAPARRALHAPLRAPRRHAVPGNQRDMQKTVDLSMQTERTPGPPARAPASRRAGRSSRPRPTARARSRRQAWSTRGACTFEREGREGREAQGGGVGVHIFLPEEGWSHTTNCRMRWRLLQGVAIV